MYTLIHSNNVIEKEKDKRNEHFIPCVVKIESGDTREYVSNLITRNHQNGKFSYVITSKKMASNDTGQISKPKVVLK